MADKNLSESEWKKFAKGRDLKDAPLVKALAELARAEAADPQAAMDALDDIEKQAASLRKSGKGDKALTAYLDDLDKALGKQRKLSEAQAKAAERAQQQPEDDEDTPALLTAAKMLPLIRQVRKGEEMHVMLAAAGREVAVLLSRRAISPARRKLLSDYLDAGTTKFFPGTCVFEENAYTFVVKTSAAGLAKKVKAALLKQLELRLKVRVRGEDPDDVDDDGDDADDEASTADAVRAAPAEGLAASGAKSTQADDAVQRTAYEKTKKSLYPRISAAVRDDGPNRQRIVTLMGLAKKAEDTKDWAEGIALYAQLSKLLDADAPDATAAAAEPGADDLKRRYDARSAKLIPQALAALKAKPGDASKIRAVAEFAREKSASGNYKAAMAALDQLDKLLGEPADAGPAAPAKSAPDEPEAAGAASPAAAASVAFNTRLAALMPQVKAAITAAGPNAAELKLKVSQAGVLARKKDLAGAHALLDEAETLLQQIARQADAATTTRQDKEDRADATPAASPLRAEYDALRARIEPDYLSATAATGNSAEMAEQVVAIRRAWDLAEEAAAAGNDTRALTIMKQLADGAALDRLRQAREAGTGQQTAKAGPSLVAQRRFMLTRWSRIPAELDVELQTLTQSISTQGGDSNPKELAQAVGTYLQDLLRKVKAQLDDAINAGNMAGLKGLRRQVEQDKVLAHLVNTPFMDGSRFRSAVLDAMDEIEAGLTA